MSQGYNKKLSSLLVKIQKPLDIIPLSEYNGISLMEGSICSELYHNNQRRRIMEPFSQTCCHPLLRRTDSRSKENREHLANSG